MGQTEPTSASSRATGHQGCRAHRPHEGARVPPSAPRFRRGCLQLRRQPALQGGRDADRRQALARSFGKRAPLATAAIIKAVDEGLEVPMASRSTSSSRRSCRRCAARTRRGSRRSSAARATVQGEVSDLGIRARSRSSRRRAKPRQGRPACPAAEGCKLAVLDLDPEGADRVASRSSPTAAHARGYGCDIRDTAGTEAVRRWSATRARRHLRQQRGPQSTRSGSSRTCATRTGAEPRRERDGHSSDARGVSRDARAALGSYRSAWPRSRASWPLRPDRVLDSKIGVIGFAKWWRSRARATT